MAYTFSHTKKGYADKQDIENYLLVSIAPEFDTQLDRWIAAAEQFLENKIGRTFVATAETTYKFDGNGENILFIPDLLTCTSISVDGTVLDVADYHLYPANKTPKQWIALDWDRTNVTFTEDQQNVEITGTWGFSVTPPADITLATMILVASVIVIGKDGGITIGESLGDYSVSFETTLAHNAFLQDIITHYRKTKLEMIYGSPVNPWDVGDVNET